MQAKTPVTDTESTGAQVSHGLNLTLELRDPHEMPILLTRLKFGLEKTHAALKELHFVHFARFLPVRGNTALLVITEFDGPLEAYGARLRHLHRRRLLLDPALCQGRAATAGAGSPARVSRLRRSQQPGRRAAPLPGMG